MVNWRLDTPMTNKAQANIKGAPKESFSKTYEMKNIKKVATMTAFSESVCLLSIYGMNDVCKYLWVFGHIAQFAYLTQWMSG